MTVTIILYQNSSDNKAVSKAVTAGPSYTATLKRECTIEEPYFLLERGATDIASYNYAYCPEFHRYYYILERNIVAGGMFEIHGFVDPLMSFGAGIRNIQAVVERQEYRYNPYIEDPYISCTQGSYIKAIKGPKVGEDTYTIYLTALGSYHGEDPEGGGE